ncbi:N-acetylglucosamine-6-phosphate deacetylase [Paramaledivibacter caminithermalis]|jgi:N-acetylglucosamine-6-phosphate deacetylase|uniref:N-acetylglucosamine-6-phosphate deacetylase n=1 Tax=Paramaledivibacter caminithermalis (strain DSM 15212 / CIP 107654 / DViRD3) TaxID=1121301 RepID=A0A1M6PJA2_PARC5|nr:N-acetylglucosamine-6-phosphate deacetylase [Paramaledivibacter caminithermalis]SHK08016.1 N-acetylgalactosamine 6-phosphate deacetylase [Paramaledivibacter caminithermalis DSM 15212]
MPYLIKASEIYCENEVLMNGCLAINNNLIEDIGTHLDEEGTEIIDLTGYKIIPGLIDLHIHGANGYDTMDSNYEAVNEISKYLAKNGVTRFLPTTVTADWAKIINAVRNIREIMKRNVEGAAIIGSYIEGPFITEKKKGAHPAQFIRRLDVKDIDELLHEADGSIKVITIAPEKEDAPELIKTLTAKGIKVSLGHTNATFHETKLAIENGASIAVHVYNGMRGLHHREPGVLGAVLGIDDIYAELIADLIHVHPESIKILVKCKGTDKICLISDCMMAGGLSDGEYKLGELEVAVKDGIPRLSNGSLAGSTLKIINAVKNMIEKVGVSPLEAVHMASLVPAKILGIDDEYGSIKINKKADLTIIDNDFNVIMTIVNGKIVYRKKSQR